MTSRPKTSSRKIRIETDKHDGIRTVGEIVGVVAVALFICYVAAVVMGWV